MTTGTRVRDWATVDFYATLGVTADATDDEIARAFRTLAKHFHPDARQHDPGTDEQFRDIATAYEVIGDPRNRLEYDRVRADAAPPTTRRSTSPAPAPAPQETVRRPWTRRRCWTVLVTGIVLTVLGVLAALATWGLHAHDADQRARFVPVQATRVAVDGEQFVAFTTHDGHRVLAPEPHHHGDPVQQGEAVAIRYDPKDPRHVVLDASTFGRDITLAIVALKLLVGGPVFSVVGWRRLRRAA